MTAPSAATSSALGLGLLTLAASGFAAWTSYRTSHDAKLVREEVARLAAEVSEVRGVLQLLRYERGGGGAHSLVEQLKFWAPKLQHATTPAAEMPEVKKKVGEIQDAIAVLGKDAWAPLEAAFTTSTSDSEDEFRRQCLAAFARLDKARGTALLVRLVKGIEQQVSPRLRLLACDELIQLDKQIAGSTLREVLTTQSSQGVNLNRLAPDYAAKIAASVSGAAAWSGFFNLVGKYLATDDSDTDATLQMLLTRAEHDRTTVQECVKALGSRRCKDAAPRIRELFKSPPPPTDDPIFKNHCLEAISQIEGEAARSWFDEILRAETNPIVQTKLQDLLKLVR